MNIDIKVLSVVYQLALAQLRTRFNPEDYGCSFDDWFDSVTFDCNTTAEAIKKVAKILKFKIVE